MRQDASYNHAEKGHQAGVQMGFYFVAQDLLEGCSLPSLTAAGKASGCQALGRVSNLPVLKLIRNSKHISIGLTQIFPSALGGCFPPRSILCSVN